MQNKILTKILSCLLVFLMVCLCLSACTQGREKEEETAAPVVEESFTPALDKGEESDLYKRYTEYKENSTLAFKSNAPLSKESFEYEVVNGEVKITLYVGEESIIIIPDKIDGMPVTVIGEGAFSGGIVGAVYVPDTVKSIELGAFESCEGLSTIRLPFIGDGDEIGFLGHIFGASDADSNAVIVPARLDMVIVGAKYKNVADNAFKRCKSLSAVVFEGDIDNIGKLAFYECDDLVYINLEKACGTLGEYALAGCDMLYSADVSGFESVGDGAFYSCRSLNNLTVKLSDGEYLGRLFGSDGREFNGEFVSLALRRVIVGEGTEKIPEFYFANCKYITDVILPESLISIGTRAFSGCRSLGCVTIPDSVKTICDDAFFGCDAISSLSLGDGLESIGMQAFFGCEKLTQVEFPRSLKTISASAFYGCVALEKAAVGEGVTVGKNAFGNCPRLINTEN